MDFPKFEDIPVSTKTFIIRTNINVDIHKLHECLPITPYTIVPKKRGRKKRANVDDPNKGLENGSIITVDLAGNVRGVLLKEKKRKEGKHTDYFRNSVTVVMIMDGKQINFKISRNGTFQMTGCKKDEHAESCAKYIWSYIKDHRDVYTIPIHQPFRALFVPAMRNIDFNLGFLVDREKLDTFFNMHTPYCSLFEPIEGYTGVNIKIPVMKPISELKIKELSFRGGGWLTPKYVPFQKYFDTLNQRDREKRKGKERYNTVLAFRSGKAIISSMCEDFAREAYEKLIEIVKAHRAEFEEKI